jgi:hypothetical protein
VVYSFDFECIEDGGDVAFELYVYDGADDLSGGMVTCEICPFLREWAAAVAKELINPFLRRFRTNINR